MYLVMSVPRSRRQPGVIALTHGKSNKKLWVRWASIINYMRTLTLMYHRSWIYLIMKIQRERFQEYNFKNQLCT